MAFLKLLLVLVACLVGFTSATLETTTTSCKSNGSPSTVVFTPGERPFENHNNKPYLCGTCTSSGRSCDCCMKIDKFGLDTDQALLYISVAQSLVSVQLLGLILLELSIPAFKVYLDPKVVLSADLLKICLNFNALLNINVSVDAAVKLLNDQCSSRRALSAL